MNCSIIFSSDANFNTQMFSKIYTYVKLFVVFIIVSCNTNDNALEKALILGHDNRGELEKVLDYYSKDPKDSLKYKAACFLIENMLYHYSFDTTFLKEYRSVVKRIGTLRNNGYSVEQIKNQANPLMDSVKSRFPLSKFYENIEYDLLSIDADFLINTIEQSFVSFTKNPFKDSINYADFLEYILPYRAHEGYCLENWRSYFVKTYSNAVYKTNYTNVHQLCDSLMSQTKEKVLGYNVAPNFPYIKLIDYIPSLLNCTEKARFNCLLFRSFGVPIAIDFVPASRVNETGHSWNALIINGKTEPIDAFWENGIVYYGDYIGRKKIHPNIGSIQYPKIYRQTYKINITDILLHSLKTGEDIPALFSNPYQQDVTNEYFETYALQCSIDKKIEGLDYVYACVMGKRSWEPVAYGKVKRNNVSIFGLGSKNVYLPAYYKSNHITPASFPILMDTVGNTSILRPDSTKLRKIKVSTVAHIRPGHYNYNNAFIGVKIEASNDKDFKNSEVLYHIENPYAPGTYRIPFKTNSRFRYIRIVSPDKRALVFNELSFYSDTGKLVGKLIPQNSTDSILIAKAVDGDLKTSLDFRHLNNKRDNDQFWFTIDFGHPVSVKALDFYFVHWGSLRKQGIYELVYWDYGWKSLGHKKALSTKSIYFDNVPDNALLRLNILDSDGAKSRIFTYSEGKQNWF